MSKIRNKLLAVLLCVPGVLVAGEAEIKAKLLKAMPGLNITSVSPSEMGGMYQVEANGQTLFASSDGEFFVTGELYSVKSGELVNLTEVKREKVRADTISGIAPNQKITFPAKGETKAKVAVFTDIDCGYCRKLHAEVPKMNEMGIEVSYLAFPRAGIGSGSYNKIVSAWCADDQLQAMTDAKMGKSIKSLTCDNPVASQYQLGQEMGINGTPAIVMESGELVPGYVPADRLGKLLGIL